MTTSGNRIPDFVPLTTRQGILPGDIVDNLQGRQLIIWGCGHLGRVLAGVFRRVARRDFQAVFCDRRASALDPVVDDLAVLHPADCIEQVANGRAFCVVAVAGGGAGVEASLTRHGASPSRDFMTYRHVSRPEAYVKAAGTVDGTMRYLDATAFQTALEKLLREIPHVMQVSIVGEPDPLAHPEIHRIVAAARGRVATSVTGRLHAADLGRLESVAEAGPNLLAFRTALPGEPADVADVRCVLDAIARLRDRFGGATEFRILRVRRETPDKGTWQALLERMCAELHLPLIETEGYVEPYDLLLDERAGEAATEDLRAQQRDLTWDVGAALQSAMAERGRPCLSQRIFPVIGPDLSVDVCHLYRSGRVAASFLDAPYDELVAIRHTSAHCRACQARGLHRLDIDVLRRRHPQTCFDRGP